MTLKPARAAWLTALILMAPPFLHPACAQDEVTITADVLKLDVPSDSYQAEGAVRLTRDGLSLIADSVIYRRLTADAEAQGNVFAEKEGDTLKGDRLFLNMESQQGELINGEIFVKKPNFRMRGKRIEKTGDEDYHVARGSFTTCDGPHPSWHFEARDLDVTLDKFATGRDAVFYIGSVPVLYSPYVLFPVQTDRQSGLLLPRLGQSSKKGFYYNQPYYWAINPSQDLTANLDLESERGAGLGVDYRYLRNRGSSGEMQGFGIYDTHIHEFRGELNQKHLELFSPELTLASEVHLVTDRTYFRDFSEDFGEYNRQLLESTASFDRRWERYGLSGEVRYIEDLVSPNNHATLQRLPALSFTAAGTKLGPAYFSMDSAFINFERMEGTTGQRLELHPRLSLYQKPAGVLDLSVYGGYRERIYNSYGIQAPRHVQTVGQADAGSILSLPLERIYDGRLRHLMVPALEFGYLQSIPQGNLPEFDVNDRLPGYTSLVWSVTNRWTQKVIRPEGAPEYRDFLYLKLSQGYWFTGERLNLLNLPQADLGHRLSDLMLEGKFSPLKGFSFALDGRYDPVENHLSTANAGLELRGEGTTPKVALLSYRYSREELHYLEGSLAYPLTRELQATFLGRYSFDKAAFLEQRYSLEYKRQCWGIIASYSDRAENKAFTVNFTLAGIGSLVPIRAF